jgi:hypothetical protein
MPGSADAAYHLSLITASSHGSRMVGLMGDAGVQMNCPLCGAPMTHVQAEGDTHVYRCVRHGRQVLSPDGIFRQQPQ